MRLHSIKLANFRSYRESEAEGLGNFNFFGGMNGAGKSTILDALAVSLTGSCRGSETGRALEELRTTGARGKWTITLKAAHGVDPGVFELMRSEGQGPRSSAQDYMDSFLQMPPARVRACLYSGELLRVDRKDAQRLILDLCDPGVDVPAEVGALGRKHLGPAMHSRLTLTELDALYKRAYEQRREQSAALSALQVAEPDIPEGLESLADLSIEKIDAMRKEISEKISSLLRERDGILAEIRSVESESIRLRGAVDEAAFALKRQNEILNSLPAGEVLAREIEEARTKLETIEKENKQADDIHRKASQEVAALEQKNQETVKRIRTLKGIGESVCPTCQRNLDLSARELAIADLKAALVPIQNEINIKIKIRDDAAKAIDNLEYSKVVKQDSELLSRKAQRENAEAAAAAAGERLEAAKAALEKRLRLQSADDVLAQKKKAEELAERARNGTANLMAVTAYLGYRQAFECARVEVDKARVAHSELDRLVEALGPKGLRSQLAAGAEKFQEEISDLLRPMGFTCDFGPLLRLEDDPFVNGRPARLLSSSELIRFGVAFQIAVASWSKLGIVAVDDWDRLDAVSGADAHRALAGSQHQVLVFSTLKGDIESFRRKATLMRGVAFYLVEKKSDVSVIEALAEVAA